MLYVLDEPICHFSGVGSILSVIVLWEILLINSVGLIKRHIMWRLIWAWVSCDPFTGFQIRMG